MKLVLKMQHVNLHSRIRAELSRKENIYNNSHGAHETGSRAGISARLNQVFAMRIYDLGNIDGR